MSAVRFYYDNITKACLGAFDDEAAPAGATAAPIAPESGRQLWDAASGTWLWPNGVPDMPTISARQIRLALIRAGLMATVEAAIATLSDEDKVEWNYASEYRRDHPLIANMSAAIGLTVQQVNGLWTQAMAL